MTIYQARADCQRGADNRYTVRKITDNPKAGADVNPDEQLSIASLIDDELAGKAEAIGGYDAMLWKIRSGYAVFLYASVGLVAGLVSEDVVELDLKASLSLGVLIFGFSAFAAVLDYSFMKSKLQVVVYRDRLMTYAFDMAAGDELQGDDRAKLLECLKNSGERRDYVDWELWAGFWRPVILYGGTCVVCVTAAVILAI